MPDQRVVVEHKGCCSGCGSTLVVLAALGLILEGWQALGTTGRILTVGGGLAVVGGLAWLVAWARERERNQKVRKAEQARRQPFHDFEAQEWAKADRLAREEEQRAAIEATAQASTTDMGAPLPPPPLPPAAWYPDPQNPAQIRRWDGASWTDESKPA